MQEPILIVTAVKNDPAGLQRTLQSLEPLNEAFFHVIIENGDACREIAERWRSTHSDSVKYIQASDTGVYSAFNFAIQMNAGPEFIYFLNAGDELLDEEGIIELVSGIEASNSNWGYANLIVCDVNKKWSNVYQITPFNKFLFGLGIKVIQQQATVYRIDALRKIGGFDESRKISADMLAHLRLLGIGKPVSLPKVVSRFYSGGLSTRSRKEHAKDWNQILKDEKIWYALPVRLFTPFVRLFWSRRLRKKGKDIYA